MNNSHSKYFSQSTQCIDCLMIHLTIEPKLNPIEVIKFYFHQRNSSPNKQLPYNNFLQAREETKANYTKSYSARK